MIWCVAERLVVHDASGVVAAATPILSTAYLVFAVRPCLFGAKCHGDLGVGVGQGQQSKAVIWGCDCRCWPGRWLSVWSIHAPRSDFLYDLLQHELVVVVNSWFGEFSVYILLVVVCKLLRGFGLEVFLVGADVPVRTWLEVAHKSKALCQLVFEDVCLGVAYLLQQVYEDRDLSGAPQWCKHGARVVAAVISRCV